MLFGVATPIRVASMTAIALLRSSALFLMTGCAVLGFIAHPALCSRLENRAYTPNPEARAIYASRGAPFERVVPKTGVVAVIAKAAANKPVPVRKLRAAPPTFSVMPMPSWQSPRSPSTEYVRTVGVDYTIGAVQPRSSKAYGTSATRCSR